MTQKRTNLIIVLGNWRRC